MQSTDAVFTKFKSTSFVITNLIDSTYVCETHGCWKHEGVLRKLVQILAQMRFRGWGIGGERCCARWQWHIL